MKELKIAQDNRITTARYELSLMEKRILYVLIRDIRQKYINNSSAYKNNEDYSDMVINTTSKVLLKDLKETNPRKVKDALKSLRIRSFEYSNGLPESDPNHEWFDVGFINYGKWQRGGDIEFGISKIILPFFVDLTSRFTEYDLLIAISLRSKWSQRFYEFCNLWKHKGGVNLKVSELRDDFKLGDKYDRYGALKKYVIDVAQKELKELFKKGECDTYFEYSELKNGRSVDTLRLKIFQRNKTEHAHTLLDINYLVASQLQSIFETDKKPKNDYKISRLLTVLQTNPDELVKVNNKITWMKDQKPSEDWQRWLTAIFNEDYGFNEL